MKMRGSTRNTSSQRIKKITREYNNQEILKMTPKKKDAAVVHAEEVAAAPASKLAAKVDAILDVKVVDAVVPAAAIHAMIIWAAFTI